MAWAMVRSLLFFAVQLAAGLGDWSDAQIREKFPLLRVFDDALPSPLLDALEHDAKALTPRSLWVELPQRGRPESAIGRVVHALYDIAFPKRPNAHMMAARASVVGAECWALVKGSNGSHAAHFDKDEKVAFDTGLLRFPLLATVTYFGSIGGPTLVLDQTVSEDQSELRPPVPQRGGLAFPRRNRHLVFRGDRYHSVLGALTQQVQERGEVAGQAPAQRLTFLVNWWTKPLSQGGTLSFVFDDNWARSNDLSAWPARESSAGKHKAQEAKISAVNRWDLSPAHEGEKQALAQRRGHRRVSTNVHTLPLFRLRNESGVSYFHFTLPSASAIKAAREPHSACTAARSCPVMDAFTVTWRPPTGDASSSLPTKATENSNTDAKNSRARSVAMAEVAAQLGASAQELLAGSSVQNDRPAAGGQLVQGAGHGESALEAWSSPSQLRLLRVGSSTDSVRANEHLRAELTRAGVPKSIVFAPDARVRNGDSHGRWSGAVVRFTRLLAPLVRVYKGKMRVYIFLCAKGDALDDGRTIAEADPDSLRGILGDAGVDLRAHCQHVLTTRKQDTDESVGADAQGKPSRGSVVVFAGSNIASDWTSLNIEDATELSAAHVAHSNTTGNEKEHESDQSAEHNVGDSTPKAAQQVDELWHDFLVAHFNSLGEIGISDSDDDADNKLGADSSPGALDETLGTEVAARSAAVAEATASAAEAYEDAFMTML